MTTLSAAISAVRSRLGEITPSAWTDAQIVAWISEGVRDVARKTESLLTWDTIPVDTVQQQYPAPVDMLRIHHVQFQADNDPRLIPLEYHDFNAMDSVWFDRMDTVAGTPRMFTTWGNPPQLNIIIYPKSSVEGDLIVRYYRLPDPLDTNSDLGTTLEVVSGYEDLVYEYATYLALRRDRDARWREHREMYEEHLDTMMEMTRRFTDQSGTVTRQGHRIPDWLTGVGYF